MPSILYFNYAAPYAPLVGRTLTLPDGISRADASHLARSALLDPF